MESTALALQNQVTPSGAAAKRTALLSPSVDVLMIGGASLVLFGFVYLFIDKNANVNQISWAAFYLAFAVNNPHFISSYVLLYWDKRHELFTNKRFLWAAVVVPTLLLGYMVVAIAAGSPRALGYAVNFMYFTVGWHYIKQIYGTIIVTSARRGVYYSKGEAWALKLNLYPVWFLSFINGNLGIRTLMQYGVGYKTFDFPPALLELDYCLVAVSLLALVALLARKWVRDGQRPGWAAMASFAAIYIWYLPSIYHPVFWYLIPFFHSFQYLLFVTTLKKNQYADAAGLGTNDTSPAKRADFAKNFFGFIGLVLIMAFFAFKVLPEGLDQVVGYDRKVFGNELFMFLFITFINIHHYFIDNVIWRRDNPALKRYLLA